MRPRSGSGSATSPTSHSGCRELRRVLRPGGRLACSRSPARGVCSGRSTRSGSSGSSRSSARSLPGGSAYAYLPASVARFPPAEELAALMRAAGFDEVGFRLLGGLDHRAPHRSCGRRRGCHFRRERRTRRERRKRGRRMNALAGVDATPGLAAYMAELEGASCPGGRAARGIRRRCCRRGARCRRQAAAPAPLLPRLARRRRRPAACGRRRDRARPHGDSRARRSRRRRPDAPRHPFRVVRVRGRGRALGRRLPLRLCIRRARGGRRDSTRSRSSRMPASRSPAARRCSAARPASPTPRSTTTSSAARSRPGSSSRRPACSARAATATSAPTGSHSGSHSRSPTTSSTAPARRRRPARSPAPTCAKEPRRCRCSWPRGATRLFAGRLPAARSTGRSFGSRRPTRSHASREVALDYAAKARSCIGSAAHREELELLTYAVVDRAS